MRISGSPQSPGGSEEAQPNKKAEANGTSTLKR
jgi:hypothetical protein